MEVSTMNRLVREDAVLAWSEEGQGPAVVCAHGLLMEAWTLERMHIYDWTPVMEAGRRLVRYDARGHGQSSLTPDAVATPETFEWPVLAGDLLAVMDAVQPDQPVTAIGCSMGTGTIVHAAVRAPERFERLVLTASPTAWDGRRRQAAMYEQAASQIEAEGVSAVMDMMERVPRPPFMEGLPTLPADVDVRLVPALLRGMGRSDLPAPEELRRLSMPVLILAWEGDPVHPVSTGVQLAELIPDAELQVARTLEEVRGWGKVVARFVE